VCVGVGVHIYIYIYMYRVKPCSHSLLPVFSHCMQAQLEAEEAVEGGGA